MRENGPHIEERCGGCGRHIRFIPKDKGDRRSVASRKGIKPKVRVRVLERFDNACAICGRRAPEVILHIDHLIPLNLARKFDLYDPILETEHNLIVLCEEDNLGKGDDVIGPRTLGLQLRCLRLVEATS